MGKRKEKSINVRVTEPMYNSIDRVSKIIPPKGDLSNASRFLINIGILVLDKVTAGLEDAQIITLALYKTAGLLPEDTKPGDVELPETIISCKTDVVQKAK